MGLLYAFIRQYKNTALNSCVNRIGPLLGTGTWVNANDECYCCSEGGELSA
jgi:hypothetical protein